MSVGLILLLAVIVLILFGIAQRILDRMHLTDRQALLFAALIFIGGWIPDIRITPLFYFNIGGALIPLILCIYLLVKADTAWERWRSIIAAVVTGAGIYLLARFLPADPVTMPFDPNYIYGLIGGIVAYILGRSRRGAFFAGVMGVLLATTATAIGNWMSGIEQPLYLGGAGAFDAVIISGVLAVLLAELIGELIERMVRGRNPHPSTEQRHGKEDPT